MYVAKSEGCWNWIGGDSGNGRGRFAPKKGVWVYAARYSYALTNGPIPNGLVVRHKCDNARCVRPEHLEIGTQRDNVMDAVRRGRFHQKLKWYEVVVIRDAYTRGISQTKLASIYGVCQTTISAVVRGVNWSHVNSTDNTSAR